MCGKVPSEAAGRRRRALAGLELVLLDAVGKGNFIDYGATQPGGREEGSDEENSEKHCCGVVECMWQVIVDC